MSENKLFVIVIVIVINSQIPQKPAHEQYHTYVLIVNVSHGWLF